MNTRQLRKEIAHVEEQVNFHKNIVMTDIGHFTGWAKSQLCKPTTILLMAAGLYITRKSWKKLMIGKNVQIMRLLKTAFMSFKLI
jgi:hypothetical protein